MLNKKEIVAITVTVLILAFTISLIKTWQIFLYTLFAVFIALIINIVAKKIMAFYLDSEIEIKLWEIKTYWFNPGKYFKKPFPAGVFLPIIVTALSFGYLIWMGCLIFDIKPKIYKAAKRHGLYKFSEITEFQTGLIASAGIFASLIFAIIGYFLNFPEFAKINIYYAFFNILPVSDLDGNKIFFGNLVLWSFLASIVLLGLFSTIFIT